ncbi:MAG: ATP-binding cassette domain-containing protein [Oceanospirillaceae bacterium]|nr:ATP-binding cassette domain-containing protein [Oceanospirillaceae bacterium]
MLEINQLNIQLGNHSLNYHRQIATSAIVTLQGISGVGKSSLLLCIAGFIKAQSGSILWHGKDISQMEVEQRPVAMLFQENNLFEHISVLQNVRLGLVNTSDEDILQSAKQLQIAEQLHKMPAQLSGGQRQRVGILRTLLRPEPLILLDEPFAELDNLTREITADWVAQIALSRNKTLILVTHQQEDVEKLATQNWLL